MTSEVWLNRLKAVECRDSTYPAKNPALVFDKAKGSLIWDVEGRRYIDFCAGFGVLALGHNPDETNAVFTRRFDASEPPVSHGMGDVYASRAKVEFLEHLTSHLPSPLSKAALALSGSQAVELAVKTALLAKGKAGVITLDGAYHGLDLGLLPLTSKLAFRSPFEGWLKDDHVRRLPHAASRREIEEMIDDLETCGIGAAAVIVEPIQGRMGVRAHPPGWLAMLREVCDRQNVLLIYDEIFTGLGRSGRMTFGYEVPCDILCLGKALGGGLPLSACIGSREVMDAWPESEGEALHTGTFFGLPLACETGLATLKAIQSQDLLHRSRTLGEALRQELRAAFASCESVREVRGEGMMTAIVFAEDGRGAQAMDELRGRGLIALASGERGESLTLTPALNIPEALLSEGVTLIVDVLR